MRPRQATRVTPTSDPGGLGRWLQGAFTGALLHFRLAVTPTPAPRPRVGKFGTYYPANYSKFLAEVQRQLASQWAGASITEATHGAVEVVLEKPAKTVRKVPPGDLDNHAKGILDAATKVGVLKDDTLITTLAIHKRWAEPDEAPHVNLWIGDPRANHDNRAAG